ncbi:MAG: hypothetical protein FWD87_04795 [Spirochaetaceae bacterium]|nr:hypothetical protein [Spirochaetaceae bacterium]
MNIDIYARGQREDLLPTARQLVEERRYNDAVRILAEIIEREPERLDEVESLMTIVRSVRDRHNRYYENLMVLLRKEDFTDQDIAEGYRLISEIREMDANPDQIVLTLLEVARQVIVFRYNDIQFRDIMNRALALIRQERYWEAMALYKNAIGLHREMFAEERSDLILREADNMARGVTEIIDTLLTFQNSYPQAAQRAIRESSRDVYAVLNTGEYNDLINAIERMAVVREQIFTSALRVEERRDQLLRPGEYDIPFFSTIGRVVKGREAAPIDEGVLAVVDYLWRDVIDANSTLLASRASMFFDRGKIQFDEGQFRDAETNFYIARSYSEVKNNLISLKGYSVIHARGFDLSTGLDNLPANVAMDKLLSYIPQLYESENMLKASNDYLLLSQVMQRMATVESYYSQETVFNNILTFRNQIVADNVMVLRSHRAWVENEESMLMLRGANFAVDTALNLSTEMKNLFGGYERRFNMLAASVIRAGVDISYLPVSNRLQAQQAAAASGFELADGITTIIGEGEASFTVVARYHQRSMDILSRVLTELQPIENDLNNIALMISAEGGDFLAYPVLMESSENVNNDLNALVFLRNEITRYIQDSQEFITRSETYRTHGNRHLAAARASLDRDDFDAAWQNLHMARDNYVNSLNLNENPELRASSDRDIFALSDEILSRQTTFVIAAVRRNLNEARDLYTRERFGDAEALLMNSQALWRTVNPEDNNPELDFWLGLVQTATSLLAGRVILETDPLFSEMTQILNLARDDYLNAVTANQRGNRTEMLNHLNLAEEKILLVSIPFPLNQEASLLTLRILQLKDPQDFIAMFRERYDVAVQMIPSNPAEAYMRLQDLRIINPNFPGINQAIYNAEVRLGRRIPPPDPARIREAETLYQRALTITTSNIRANFPTALAYLNRAFELNPNDNRIPMLRDRVQIEMGGTATVVLSNEAQQQFRRAEQEFINGNLFLSLSIVERLLQDPRNRNYPPLLELRRRIDARI